MKFIKNIDAFFNLDSVRQIRFILINDYSQQIAVSLIFDKLVIRDEKTILDSMQLSTDRHGEATRACLEEAFVKFLSDPTKAVFDIDKELELIIRKPLDC